jgi:hypothetical protein
LDRQRIDSGVEYEYKYKRRKEKKDTDKPAPPSPQDGIHTAHLLYTQLLLPVISG